MTGVVFLLVEVIRRILILTKPLSDVIISFIYNIFTEKTNPLPPIENGILLLSASNLAKKIRNRQLKCEDVVRAYVNRAKTVQLYTNAVTDARYEEAIEDAIKIDRFLERGEKTPEQIEKDTPLLGVPFTCKEVIGIKGLYQTAGLYRDKGRTAEEDGDAPALYRNAGAIPVTVTNVPELCSWWNSTNIIFGKTTNPYDKRRTPGGSSGGEGVLLTTAGAVIGIGTDYGGSIRVPSVFNSIYGHKPSSCIVSNRGYYPWIETEKMPFDHINTTGPMCRYAEDLTLLLKILSDNNPKLQLQKKVDFKHVKIYYLEELPGAPAIPSVKKAIKKATNHFEEQYGVKAQPLKLEKFKNIISLIASKYLDTHAPPFKLILTDAEGEVNIWLEFFKSLFGMSNHTLPSIFNAMLEKRDKDNHYYECLKQFDSLGQTFQDIFKEDAVLFLPTHPETAPFHHLIIFKTLNFMYAPIFNLLGLPATSIPAGVCDGLPIGIQAVSGHCNDRLTIAAALELDNVFGGWKSPCSIDIK
ncbi:fatty-acid amide hydrolase 2-A [Parasteatoda tepidariorum]|uniref:fatty-acid amide hydrolase 2-A n=1 Tax=Parasteatoda tepidariorum TaxID=114398 RepID=UPI0039BC8D73